MLILQAHPALHWPASRPTEKVGAAVNRYQILSCPGFTKNRRKTEARQPQPNITKEQGVPVKTAVIPDTHKRELVAFQIPRFNRTFIGLMFMTWAYTPRFWLGFLSGLIVHLITKPLFGAAFIPNSLSAVMAGFIVCAGLGVTIGLATYFVYEFHHHSKPTQGWSTALSKHIVSGLMSVFLGAGITGIAYMIAKLGILIASTLALITLGMSYALITEPEISHDHWLRKEWYKRALQGAAFSLAGCVIGLAFASLFSAHGAPIMPAEEVRVTSSVPISTAAFVPAVPHASTVPVDPVLYAQALKVAQKALGHK